MATEQRVIREANLIARQFECLGAGPAAVATADHIRRFWAPLLRTVLLEEACDHLEHFSPIARHAIAMLPKQTSGTRNITNAEVAGTLR